MSQSREASAVIVRPEPSRGLGAFYRNLGITLVSTHLRAHGVSTRLVDLTFDPMPDRLDPETRVALFSLYIDDFSQGIEAAEHIKRNNPQVFTAVGGPHVTLLGPSVFNLGDIFDLACLGDCLPEAVPLLASMAAGGSPPSNRVVTASSNAARMDTLAPDYSIWPSDRYFPVFPVEMSRGCRQHCPFCTDPVLRRGLASAPVERTMATIRGLVDEYGRIWVRFVDSSMSSLGDDLERLLDALIAAELPVQWSAYAYPHDITEELARRMAAAGCVGLFLGIESLSPGVRVGKHHAKHPGEVTRAVEALHRYGIFVHGNFIVGLPGETEETLMRSRSTLGELHLDSVGGGPFFLTPGSTFHRAPRSAGIEIFEADWALQQHVSFYDSEREYFRTATLSQREMRRLATEFRLHVETSETACWNLSDYAVLCWMSVGGRVEDLTRLWRTDTDLLTDDQQLVLGVLKEKKLSVPAASRSRFVEITRTVAASERPTGGS